MNGYMKIGGITVLSKKGSKNWQKKGAKRGKFKGSVKLTKMSTKQIKKK